MQKQIKKTVSNVIQTMSTYNSTSKDKIEYLNSLISMRNDTSKRSVDKLQQTLKRPVQLTSYKEFGKEVLIDAILKGDLMASYNLSDTLINEQLKLIFTAYRNDMLAFMNNKDKKKVLKFKETYKAIDNAKGVLYV